MIVDNKKLFVYKNIYRNNLTESDKENLFCQSSQIKNFSKIGKNIFHVKERYDSIYILNELIGEKISEHFNIDTVKSILATNDSDYKSYILLTKIFTNKNEFYSTFDNLFFKAKINNEIGLDNLKKLKKYIYNGEKHYMDNKNFKNLKYKIKKMVIRDYITSQSDRHNYNFLFKVQNNFIDLLPLFDYEHSFSENIYCRFNNYFNFDLSLEKVIKYIKTEQEFQEILHKAMDININKIIKEIENEYPIKFEEFEKHDYIDIINENKEKILKHKLLK